MPGLLSKVETVKPKGIPPMLFLFEGKGKTGKTSAALRFPRPLLLDFPSQDGGKFHPGCKCYSVTSVDEVRGLAKELRGSKDFDTVIVDTAVCLWEMIAGPEKLGIQEYEPKYRTYLSLVDDLVATGCHVILIAHTRDITETVADAKGEAFQKLKETKNRLPAALSRMVFNRADQVVHLYTNPFGKYMARFGPGDRMEAGGRLHGLPAKVSLEKSTAVWDQIKAAATKQFGGT